jgi:hypothetical protein
MRFGFRFFCLSDYHNDNRDDNRTEFVMSDFAQENFQNVPEEIPGKTDCQHPRETSQKVEKQKGPGFNF